MPRPSDASSWEHIVTDRTGSPAHTFVDRHIGPDATELVRILDTIGVDSLDELARKAVPSSILDTVVDGVPDGLATLPPALSEHEVLSALADLAGQNTVATS
ncbi:hypothetical protein, partial [Rhodococcus sp. EPR-147]